LTRGGPPRRDPFGGALGRGGGRIGAPKGPPRASSLSCGDGPSPLVLPREDRPRPGTASSRKTASGTPAQEIAPCRGAGGCPGKRHPRLFPDPEPPREGPDPLRSFGRSAGSDRPPVPSPQRSFPSMSGSSPGSPPPAGLLPRNGLLPGRCGDSLPRLVPSRHQAQGLPGLPDRRLPDVPRRPGALEGADRLAVKPSDPVGGLPGDVALPDAFARLSPSASVHLHRPGRAVPPSSPERLLHVRRPGPSPAAGAPPRLPGETGGTPERTPGFGLFPPFLPLDPESPSGRTMGAAWIR